ncbi:OmpA family protein [Cytophaga hutchinsonii ATCC 33406]|nr:OmpA family protein [Cytophaga hutchinsonii ATCC 33406]
MGYLKSGFIVILALKTKPDPFMRQFVRASKQREVLYVLHIVLFLVLHPYCIFAQANTNIIPNGSFESGNTGFESSFQHSSANVPPGYYTITDQASYHNKDFKDPVGGDHTEGGYGLYMIINSDGTPGKKAWCGMVDVIPNSEYNFSLFFCNLYRLLPPKTNFAFESGDVKGNDPNIKVTIGSEEILIERDYFHMFKWLNASTIWYSGEHKGPVRVCIENLNSNATGNDLALDDISMVYIRTMPFGYKHPERISSIMHQDYTKPVVPQRKVALSEYGIVMDKKDTLNNGVYAIQYKKPVVIEIVADTAPAYIKVDRVVLKNLLFSQSKSELLPQAAKELDMIAEWMNRETDVRVRFIGHTDNQGDAKLNVLLSEQRVSKVKAYLVSKGIAADRIETVGYGGAFPITDNAFEETRKLNRRVEMEILK